MYLRAVQNVLRFSFKKHGLEWLYRLYKEPWRFVRMLDLPRFILRVIANKIRPEKPERA